MNDDGLFSRCHSTRNGIGEIGEGFDLYRRRDTNWRDIREKVGEFLGISVEKYARDMATTGPGNCGQVIDVTGAHGRMRNKSGSIKVKERDEGIFFFSLFNLICRIIY